MNFFEKSNTLNAKLVTFPTKLQLFRQFFQQHLNKHCSTKRLNLRLREKSFGETCLVNSSFLSHFFFFFWSLQNWVACWFVPNLGLKFSVFCLTRDFLWQSQITFLRLNVSMQINYLSKVKFFVHSKKSLILKSCKH